MMRTDDPVRDAERYFSDLEDKEKHYITCVICGNVMLDGDEYYLVDDDPFCPDCMDAQFKREVCFYD